MRIRLLPRKLTGLLLLICATIAHAQQTDTTFKVPAGEAHANKVISYYRYFPPGYAGNEEKYPVIIFLHGRGEAQTINNGGSIKLQDITALLKSGTPPKLLADGTRSALSNFIVISPQSPYTYWNEDFVSYLIDYMLATYPRIDPERVYLTGLSMGGTGCWKFAEKYPEKIAAMIPIASSGTYTFDCSKPELPIWSFWGEIDTFKGERGIVRNYNESCPREIPAKISMIPAANHSSLLWGTVYNTRSLLSGLLTGLSQDTIYNWLLAHRRTLTRVNLPPTAFAGEDQTVLLPAGSVILSGEGKDQDGQIVSYQWTQISGNNVKLEGANAARATVSGLTEGSYEFKFTVTDDRNITASDIIKITVERSETILYRINSGGIMVADSLLNWESDKQALPTSYLDVESSNHTTGSNTWKGNNLSDAPDNVFGNHRFDMEMNGPMMFNFPVENGTYVIKLYFSSAPSEGAGERIFNVLAEGIRVLDRFDIAAEFGNAANQKNFSVTVEDRMLDIDFESIAGYPRIDAIEIRKASSKSSQGTGVTLMGQTVNTSSYLSASPQPVTESTTFTFIPDTDGEVTLEIKDLQGQIRASLFAGQAQAGIRYDIYFNAEELEEGIYLAELKTRNEVIQYRIMATK